MPNDLIEDPGPVIIQPPKGDGPPIVVLPEGGGDVFHKFEGSLADAEAAGDDGQALLEGLRNAGAEGEISLVELLLPAVQGEERSLEFLKFEWSEENQAAVEDAQFDGVSPQLLLPAVQASDGADLFLKVTFDVGTSPEEQPSQPQYGWVPLDDALI